MQGGNGGWTPGPPPYPKPQTSSSMSPSASPPTHVGLDFVAEQHQRQQIGFRQSLQKQQFRNPEGDKGHLPSPSGVHIKKSNGSPQHHGTSQIHEEKQNDGQKLEYNRQNSLQQAYHQYPYHAVQQKSLANNQEQHQSKVTMVGPSRRENDIHIHTSNTKMPGLMPLQTASQSQASLSKKSAEQLSIVNRHTGNMAGDQRGESKSPQTGVGQFVPSNMARPGPSMQSQTTSLSNNSNKQVAMAQLQAIHAWASENGIDLSLPGNANLISQLIPSLQLRPSEIQRFDKNNIVMNEEKQQAISSSVGNENVAYESFMGSPSGHPGMLKSTQSPQIGLISTASRQNNAANTNNNQMQQQFNVQSNRENQNGRVSTRNSMFVGSDVPVMHPSQHSDATNNTVEHTNLKNPPTASETHHNQHARELQELDRSISQSSTASSTGDISNQSSAQAKHVQMPQKLVGFTKQQEHVLKAQILAFRRLKIIIQTGQGAIPDEILIAIVPPPLDPQAHQKLPVSGIVLHETNYIGISKETVSPSKANDIAAQMTLNKSQSMPKEGSLACEETAVRATTLPGMTTPLVEQGSLGSFDKATHSTSTKSVVEGEHANQQNSIKCDPDGTKGMIQPVQSTATYSEKAMVSLPSSNATVKDGGSKIKYHGPIFDFPSFMRRHESSGSTSVNHINFVLSTDVDELIYEEGTKVFVKKKEENLRKVGHLLAMNLERKMIKPDLALRLQIEEKRLRLSNYQARLRDEVEHQQQEIMAMPDRPYRKFVKQCERQRIELLRQIQLSQKVLREKQLKSIFQWRKKLLEAHWAIRDARTTCNRGIAKYHEKMLKEYSKRKDYGRNKRMEALKNNDVDRYREMLLEQQTDISGDATQRYSVLSSFLTQTEEYLSKLGGKITVAKNYQEVEEASRAAAAAARAQGLLEEEVKAAAACAGEEVMIRNRFSEMNASMENSSINKYYNLAHTVNERVVQQPSMLRTGTLRDYQLVGLQWMLSLYNNKLNGILADEMGLGKTVQVMALIAHLMEYKGNYGPHLIIVPNAVLVNWKSELQIWLPSVSCVFYVGGKDHRTKLFSQEVCAMKFNILVTTYEFVMFDRSKLSKIDWKYIIIDEAQRMKNRESVLARDLDRYRCQRRLLLTGTPLQNDLKELWSLLNLLLPEVFDNRKAFHDWFSKPFQKDGQSSQDQEEDDWLETEKKVIIIHRLHQILEPFMLRRRLEDVEGSLPRKVSIVLRCRMSAMQSAIYDWIKATGTFRVDPEDELLKVQKNPSYQVKMYKNLSNKCMELRKVCNHPLLNYPYFNDYSKDFLVRSCGKLWMLDRILIKLHRAGHHVLLFSTMTKLLDILEEYLQWRRLSYRRIDGSTTLEDRESAIVDFNNPDSDCFIFLLSIRAAGRGLNLQTADTVVIYDPDPNPQNEEQAVARAHRIGQKREVKVIYMQAVVDKMTSYQKEDQLRSGCIVDSEDDLAGKDRYVGTIEGLIRNNIQQCKIDMANEVINAGRFDQRTTHEERRVTLETLLHDEERYQETVHDVPSLQEVNRMVARSDQEIKLFDQMDEEFNWTGDMMKYYQVPNWLRAGSKEIEALVASLSKSSKNIPTADIHLEPKESSAGAQPSKTERRGRPRSSSNKRCIYTELEDEDVEDSDASSLQEECETEENENDERTTIPGNNKDKFEEEGLVGCGVASDFPQALDRRINNNLCEEADSGSSGNLRMHQLVTPSLAPRKFGSFSSIEAKPDDGVLNRLVPEEVHEDGENAISGDSRMDFLYSQTSCHDRDDGEDEHIVQPKLKRKRSIRFRSRHTSENTEGMASKPRPPRGTQFSLLGGDALNVPSSDFVSKFNLASQKIKTTSTSNMHAVSKFNCSNGFSGLSTGNAAEHSSGSYRKATRSRGQNFIDIKPFDIIQRKCKSVISKFQRRVDNDGPHTVPVIFDFWKNSPVSVIKKLLDPTNIHHRVEGFKYSGLSDFIADVQLMLRNSVKHFGYSYEVSSEAKKLEYLFFDIMKVSFPDTDFLAVRDAANFSAPVVSVRASHRSPITTEEDIQPQRHTPKLPKVTLAAKSNSNGNQSGSLCPTPVPTHPGDLVIRRGKRKDRDKSAALPGRGRNARIPFQKDEQQAMHHVGWARQIRLDGGGLSPELQWAKPAKRSRIDTSNKRKSTHF